MAARDHRPQPPASRRNPWARIAALYAELETCRSATAVLDVFCAGPSGETGAAITVRRLEAADRPATLDQRSRLGVSTTEPVSYRKVQLMRGSLVLSEASNWYVPGRLTAAMNARLTASDIPFGRAVAALNPARRTIASRSYWIGADLGAAPAILFDYHAILRAESGHALAEVEEHYTVALLDVVREPA